MQYPLMSEYVSAIRDASDNLDELAHLVPVLDDHGEPYRSSGAFAVVFKMKDEQTGKCYALKCFLEEQEGRAEAYRLIADELDCIDSSYVTSVKYLEKEIFVDSSCEEDEFPVLLMDWIDGETMESYIAENYQDNYVMAMLCYRFCKMAEWLRSQQIAHGDIKPDNIMVRPDGYLTLIDYDGMFVPAMNGQKSPTIGTKDFSHPLRTVDDFDETIDDFALASIALSLKAISLKPSLLDEYGAADRLLFSADDYRDLSKSKVITALQELMNDDELTTLLSMFLLVNAKKSLAMCLFRLFDVEKTENQIKGLGNALMKKEKITFLRGSIGFSRALIKKHREELENAVVDEDGVKYSSDRKKILKVPNTNGPFTIKNGTEIIGYKAFFRSISYSNINVPEWSDLYPFHLKYLANSCITIPNSVTSIEEQAFMGCSALSCIIIPDSVISIGDSVFRGCQALSSIIVPNSVKEMEGNPFVGWDGKLKVLSSMFTYDNDVLIDKDKNKIIAFRKNDISYIVPNGVTSIGDSAFYLCRSLSRVIIPDSVTSIGNCAFRSCDSLSSIVIPNSVTNIGNAAFAGCKSLSSIVIPDSVKSIGSSAFAGCDSLSSIVIPDSVTSIRKGAFFGCNSLAISIKKYIIYRFGKEVFERCL